jgi:hypothetical protein
MKDELAVSTEVRDKIIKEYLLKAYHWTIGLSMFIIGILLGILIG